MRRRSSPFLVILALGAAAAAAGCGSSGSSAPLPPLAEVEAIREATGPGASAVQATIDTFRAGLGAPDNGNAPGSLGAGRREVDWEVGDGDAAPALFPEDYFNDAATRGLFLSGRVGLELQVSADASNPTMTAAEFGNVNATYPTAFAPFSGSRLFSPLNDNEVELRFFVPGTSTPATVKGVGVVVTDVDVSAATRMACYDAFGRLLLERAFLTTPGNGSLSFLGVTTTGADIARVVLTLGEGTLGPDDVTQGGADDLVVLDDIVYGEPQPIP